MDSKSHRILKSSIIELTELIHAAQKADANEYARSLQPLLDDREVRYTNGIFYSESGDSGTSQDSDGSS
jgi:hypothetical protein